MILGISVHMGETHSGLPGADSFAMWPCNVKAGA